MVTYLVTTTVRYADFNGNGRWWCDHATNLARCADGTVTVTKDTRDDMETYVLTRDMLSWAERVRATAGDPFHGICPREGVEEFIAHHVRAYGEQAILRDRRTSRCPQLAGAVRDWAATRAGAPYREDACVTLAAPTEASEERLREIVDTFRRHH